MKKLNSLTNPITGLDGAPIMDEIGVQTVGRMLANVLARGQSADPVKAMMVAMQIHSQKSVDLEEAEFAFVKEAVEKDVMLTNLGKAAMLTALDGAKEKA